MILAVVLLMACGGDDGPGPQPSTTPSASTGDTAAPLEGCETVSWGTTADPFLSTWCTSCHSSQLEGELRYGAPDGIDFDTYDGALAWAARIRATSTVEPTVMPPAGGVGADEMAQMALWLDCGLPGEPDAPAADCSGDVLEVASLPTGCVEPVAVTGDVVIDASTDLSCVCSIDGSLDIRGGEVRLAALASVGGDLVVSGGDEVDVGSLATVGGDLTVTAPALHTLEVRRLEAVTGDVSVVDTASLALVPFVELREVGSLEVGDNPGLTGLDLSRLQTVTGDLWVHDNAALATLFGEAYALEAVGGDLVLADNPSWGGFYGFAYLVSVGGDLRLERLGWETTQGFTALDQVGGSLVVADNPALRLLDGFNQLTTVGGALEIVDNPALEGEDAFDFLDTVGGDLVIEGNAKLALLNGLPLPRDVGGIRIIDNAALPAIGGFNQLETVSGAVVIRDMPGVTIIDGFHNLSTVGGDVELSGMAGAASAVIFDDVVSIGGHLVMQDLPGIALPQIVPRLQTLGGDYVARRVGWSFLRTGPNFQSIGGRLVADGNQALERIDDFGNLTAGGGLEVLDNPLLTEVGGLAGLTAVNGDLRVEGNPALPGLTGLDDVDFVAGSLVLHDNALLGSVLALHGVQGVGADLVITDNPSLPTSAADALAAAIDAVAGSTTISGNAP